MKRVEEELRNIRQQMEQDFLLHSERISAQQQSIERVERALEFVKQEFHNYAHTSRSYHETWAAERKRNMRMLDVIQAGLMTDGLETETRLDNVERRLTRLEENQSGAA